MRLVIETVDTVREFNRWEIADLTEQIPDWAQLTDVERQDRVAGVIGEGAEFCKNLEADTLERDLISFEVEAGGEQPR
jgi:hypothetical protein